MSLATFANSAEKKRPRNHHQNMAKELSLSDQQKSQMNELRADYRNKLKELDSNASLNKDDKKSKKQELFKSHKEQVAKVLTPEQQTKMDKMRENRKGNHKFAGNRKHNKDGKKMRAKGQNMAKELNLTDEQKSQIKDLNNDFKAKSSELAKNRKSEAEKILTPEQQAKMKEMRENRTKNFGKDRKHFSHKGGRKGYRGKLDAESQSKMKVLRENYKTELSSIEKSRIAPEMQEKRKTELRSKFKEDMRQIRKEAREKKADNPS